MTAETTRSDEIKTLTAIAAASRGLATSNNVFVQAAALRILIIVQDVVYELDPSVDLPWSGAPVTAVPRIPGSEFEEAK